MDYSEIEKATKMIDEAKAIYKKAVSDAIQPGLKYVAETYGDKIHLITIIGWTPGFNDGEPCEHTSDCIIGYEDLQDYGLEYIVEDIVEEMVEELDDPDAEYDRLMSLEIEKPKEVRDFIWKVLHPYYEEMLNTNYMVRISFADGKYEVVEEEYDCGY